MYTNVRGLQSKRQELSAQACDLNPDIIILCETWCNPDISNDILQINGYYIENTLRKDRNDTVDGRGGGLLVYVKNGLTVLESDKTNNFNQYSSFDVFLSENRKKEIILVYRSPNSSSNNNESLCKLLEEMSESTIMIGDINFPGIKWKNGTSDSKGRQFFDTVNEHCITQMVDESTHIKGGVLDLILSKNPEQFVSIDILNNLTKSDHYMIMTEVACNVSRNTTKEMIYDWKKANIDDFKSGLQVINWENCFANNSTKTCWNIFKEKLNTLQDQFVPKKLRRQNNRPPWMNHTILTMIRKKKRLFKSYRKSNSEETLAEYTELEKKVDNLIKNAKKKLEKHISKTKENSEKKFNSYIKSNIKSKSTIGPLKNEHGNTVADSAEMANILNKHFSSVFTRESTNEIPDPTPMNINVKLSNVEFNSTVIKQKIDKLKNGSAPGTDGIGVFLLKTFKDQIVGPLTMIFNKSFSSGDLPEDWLEANVTPIPKKGTKSNPANYRPVSLTSICCKLMESIIKDKVIDHLDKNNLIKESQHGFTKNKSCATNLLEFLETVYQAVDKGEAVDILYMDFAKAFDKVPYQRLLKKIRAHGIDGRLYNWISSWLQNRRQRVVLNGSFSTWMEVFSGVPQGSVLGPLLFIIFINDIDEGIAIDILRKFADDTKGGQIVTKIEDQQKLQESLNSLLFWSQKWEMEFNVSKCKILHVGKNNPKYEYYMNSQKLQSTESEKDIGVHIDSSLKPSLQCREAAKNANFVLMQITRCFHYRDKEVFLNLYKRFVRPHLEFSTTTWSPWAQADKDILEKVQIRAVNMISGLNSNDYQGKLKEIKLASLESRRVRFDMIQVYKILHKIDKVEESTWFTRTGQIHERVTRQASDPLNLCKKRPKTALYANFFTNRVIDQWNELPSDVKNARNVKSFKIKFDRLNI